MGGLCGAAKAAPDSLGYRYANLHSLAHHNWRYGEFDKNNPGHQKKMLQPKTLLDCHNELQRVHSQIHAIARLIDCAADSAESTAIQGGIWCIADLTEQAQQIEKIQRQLSRPR